MPRLTLVSVVALFCTAAAQTIPQLVPGFKALPGFTMSTDISTLTSSGQYVTVSLVSLAGCLANLRSCFPSQALHCTVHQLHHRSTSNNTGHVGQMGSTTQMSTHPALKNEAKLFELKALNVLKRSPGAATRNH